MLLAIVAVGALARFATLDLQSYRHDEAVTAGRILHASLWKTISTIPGSESTPPLYYLLAWAWSKLFGVGEVGLRSLSALFGTATIAVVYATGAKLASRRAGLVAAALVALSPVLIWFSQDARAYSLAVLLSALSFLFFVGAITDGGNRQLVGWALFSALALATHYFTAFLVAPEALWLLLRARGDWRRPALAVGAVLLVGAALLPLAIHQAGTGHADWVGRQDLAGRIGRTAVKFAGDDGGDEHGVRQPGPLPAAIPLLLVLSGLALLALRGDGRERRDAGVALAIGGLGIVLPLLIGGLGPDYFLGRNLLPLFIPLTLVVAIGFAARRAGFLGLGCGAALCLASLAYVIEMNRLPRLQREDLRHAAHLIGPKKGPRAIVTVKYFADTPLAFYLDARGPAGGIPALSEIDVVGYGTPGKGSSQQLPRAFHRAAVLPATYNFTLTRFRSPQPVRVPYGTLSRGSLVGTGGRAAVLVQR